MKNIGILFSYLLGISSSWADASEANQYLESAPIVNIDNTDMTSMMGPNTLWQTPSDCGEMSVWDVGMGMCMPLPMAGMPMKMLMVHGNIFGSRIAQTGPRGRSDYASTHMIMGDVGTTVGDHHYFNLDLMLTGEKWTVPTNGYPLLLQIGERNQQGLPFMDAQHPHSSPIMGITFSDTISLGQNKNHVKFFFAPRGETTDGPVAFMHRPTGIINSDAPLGHHIGQDVGHISSTVIGASLKLGNNRFEASAYHGAEPEPTNIDLPLATPDSFSFRYIQEFSPSWMAMASLSRVNAPEHDEPDIVFENRYSGSVYTTLPISSHWIFQNTFIYGLVTQYDHASYLSSFAEEFLFRGDSPRIWGRIELLQRTGAELAIPTVSDPNQGLWVAAFTLGYTHRLASVGGAEVGVGGSVTETVVPGAFNATYGGNPWSGKVFIQLGGMHMWGI